ncbi:hypothetical protein Kisp01_37060 [Kineosporia sp. NBRC 101677]|uniref:hypothetical protein n=1 Tax=Kineosporia sp. NBRC 101677 TaxID=3032197 RepID=UPI0024A45018|nr:hypothetical protein [Kineosporia sp. NBRC 101677]GLY16691.1 hypothetical protein Kisp01_37060 [Kineosporia sp. NBRC 101677]
MDEDMLRQAAEEGKHRAEALDALRAWLLLEDSYERGGVPDEVMHFIQDHISGLLGPRAQAVAGEHLRGQLEAGRTLSDLARDRSFLIDLLALVEGKRRPGFELQWRADRLVLQQEGQAYRPQALLVMAEYSVEDPVWDRPVGTGEPVSLAELGVSDALVQRLRAWNEQFEQLALTDFEWESPEIEAAWVRQGLDLAYELQRELPDLDVRYFHADDDRPLHSV